MAQPRKWSSKDRNRYLGSRLFQGLLLAAVLGLLLALALRIVPTYARRPWDFETYWYAATAASRGLNPYDTDVLSGLAERPVGMPFLYPPITVPLWMPFTLLTIEKAAQVWFLTKALLFLPLVLLWRRYFLPNANIALLSIAAVFGFNGAAIWDLRAGNIAILEQVALWAGFAAFVLDRRRLFAGCVIVAALFKLFPIAFLALLLVPSRTSGPQWKLVGVSLAIFAALVLVPTLLGPSWAREFLHHVPAERPWGLVNPSALGFIDTLLGDHTTPLVSPPSKSLMIWMAYIAVVVGLSVPTLRRLWRSQDSKEWVLAGAMLYGLLMPRMMVYSYLLVIVPVLALLAPIASRFGGPVTVSGLIAAQVLLGGPLGWILGKGFGGVWSQNFSFLILLGTWLVYLAGGRHASAQPQEVVAPRPLAPKRRRPAP